MLRNSPFLNFLWRSSGLCVADDTPRGLFAILIQRLLRNWLQIRFMSSMKCLYAFTRLMSCVEIAGVFGGAALMGIGSAHGMSVWDYFHAAEQGVSIKFRKGNFWKRWAFKRLLGWNQANIDWNWRDRGAQDIWRQQQAWGRFWSVLPLFFEVCSTAHQCTY